MRIVRHFSYLIAFVLSCVGAMFLWPGATLAQIPNCKGMREGGLRLATGPVGGSYLRAGIALREAAPALDIRPCTTAGTLENLKLLSTNEVELAVAQSDVMHTGWNREHLPNLEDASARETWGKIKFENLMLVSWLFSERMQVMTSAHTYASSLQDLKGKRVWLGFKESGSYATASEVLRAAGLDMAQLKVPPAEITSYTAANEALLQGEVDAVFRMTAVPNDYNRDLTPDDRPTTISALFNKGPEIRMLSLDQNVVDRLLQGSTYVGATIYRDTYPGLASGVRTIGLGSMLVTHHSLSPQQQKNVENLFDIIHTRVGRQATERVMNIELDQLDHELDPANLDDAKILAFYVSDGIAGRLRYRPSNKYLWITLGLIVAVLFIIGTYHSESLLRIFGTYTQYIVTAGILGAFSAGFALLLWHDEHKYTPGFSTPLHAFGSLFLYFAQGMRSDAMMTANGQYYALLALAVIATLVHRFNSDVLDDSVKSWSKRLSDRFHTRAGRLSSLHSRVVLNWNDLARQTVEAWCKEKELQDEIVVFSTVSPDALSACTAGRVRLVHDDPSQRKHLAKELPKANRVLICANWKSPYPEEKRRGISRDLADSLTIRAIYAIRTLERDRKTTQNVPITAEIQLVTNEEEARLAGAPSVTIVTASAKTIVLPLTSGGDGAAPVRPMPAAGTAT